ncbi:hypothetical protein [Nostoc sp. DSM 114161]
MIVLQAECIAKHPKFKLLHPLTSLSLRSLAAIGEPTLHWNKRMCR